MYSDLMYYLKIFRLIGQMLFLLQVLQFLRRNLCVKYIIVVIINKGKMLDPPSQYFWASDIHRT